MSVHYMVAIGASGTDLTFQARDKGCASYGMYDWSEEHGGTPIYSYKRRVFDQEVARRLPDHILRDVQNRGDIIVNNHLPTGISENLAAYNSPEEKRIRPFNGIHKKLKEACEKIQHYPGRLAAFCEHHWNGDVTRAGDGADILVTLRLSKGQHVPPSVAGAVQKAINKTGIPVRRGDYSNTFVFKLSDMAALTRKMMFLASTPVVRQDDVIPGEIIRELQDLTKALGEAMSHTLPFRKSEEPMHAKLPVPEAKPQGRIETEEAIRALTEHTVKLEPNTRGFSMVFQPYEVDKVNRFLDALNEDMNLDTHQYRALGQIDFAFHVGHDTCEERALFAESVLQALEDVPPDEAHLNPTQDSLVQVSQVVRDCRVNAPLTDNTKFKRELEYDSSPPQQIEASKPAMAAPKLPELGIRTHPDWAVADAPAPVKKKRGAKPPEEGDDMVGFNVLEDGTIEWHGIELQEILTLTSTLPASKIAAQLGVPESEVESVLEQLKNPPPQLASYLNREKLKLAREEGKRNLKELKDEKARIDGSKEVMAQRLKELDASDKEQALVLKKEQEALEIKEKRNRKLSKAARAQIRAARRQSKGEIALQGLGIGGMIIAILTVMWAFITKRPMPNLTMGGQQKKKKPLELPAAKEEDVVETGAEVKVEEKVAEKVEA